MRKKVYLIDHQRPILEVKQIHVFNFQISGNQNNNNIRVIEK